MGQRISRTEPFLVVVGSVTVALGALAGGGPLAVAIGAGWCAVGLLGSAPAVPTVVLTAAVGLLLVVLSATSPIESSAPLAAGVVVLAVGAVHVLRTALLHPFRSRL